MKPFPISFESRPKFKWSLNVICIALLLIFICSCNPRVEPFKIVDFKGIEEAVDYSKTWLDFKSDSIFPAALMCNKGDLIAVDDNIFLYDAEAINNSFIIQDDDSVMYVNGKIYAIGIPDKSSMVPWFQNMENKDLSAMQFLFFTSGISDIYYPYLKEIAKNRPGTGIYFEKNITELTDLLGIFQPRYLIGIKLNTKDFGQLSGLTNLEVLWIDLQDSIVNKPLPALPKLKQIFLVMNEQKNRVLTNDFFVNNKQLEKINIQISGPFDVAVLSPLYNLKDLTVSFSDTLINFDEINRLQKLEVLSIVGNDRIYDPAKIELPALRWMTFGSDITQDEFNSFIIHHPKLEMVEIVKNEDITDYSALLKFPRLSGLTITDTVMDMATVEALKNLKYLSLPADYLDDSGNREKVQKALPGTRISANKGYLCLGSGWLLLLIPLVVIFRILIRRKPVRHSR